MEAGGDAPCRWRTRSIPGGRGGGEGAAGLTCIGVSQEGVLVLAAPQRGRGSRLILRQPREAGDAHVVHGRVGAQGALLTGLVLRRHPHPRPPAAQRLPEVVRRGPGWVAGREGPALPGRREGAPHPHPSACRGLTRSRRAQRCQRAAGAQVEMGLCLQRPEGNAGSRSARPWRRARYRRDLSDSGPYAAGGQLPSSSWS